VKVWRGAGRNLRIVQPSTQEGVPAAKSLKNGFKGLQISGSITARNVISQTLHSTFDYRRLGHFFSFRARAAQEQRTDLYGVPFRILASVHS
jgi:hypothetical protein